MSIKTGSDQSIDHQIALWSLKLRPLNEFETQDQEILRSLTQEITTLIKSSFIQGRETLSNASGFLIARGLLKLFVMGDGTVKKDVHDLLLERLRADPHFLLPENQERIQYANAPLFVVLTEVMHFKDLFKYEPYATLLTQLTASVSDESYWIKEESLPRQTPIESRSAFFVAIPTSVRPEPTMLKLGVDGNLELDGGFEFLDADALEKRLGLF